MATPGPVNRALLQSYYQNPGDVYLDNMTEGAFNTLADQIDANAGVFGPTGSQQVLSPPIDGVTGTNVYDQLVSIEGQILAAVGGIVPPGTITSAMIQNGAVSHLKLSASEQTASVGGTIYAFQTQGGF